MSELPVGIAAVGIETVGVAAVGLRTGPQRYWSNSFALS
jgi:hypothetical protein